MRTIITCAVTGGSEDVVAKHPNFPITPKEIADAAIGAAKAGAAIAHIHVRDPETGLPSTEFTLYKETVERIRDSGVDLILNLTCGMDGEIEIESLSPFKLGPGTTLKNAEDRVSHAVSLKPELGSLDCGVADFYDAIYIARPDDLRTMARLLREAGVKPEIECFDFKHIENAKMLIEERLIDAPPVFQLCLGTGDGAPAHADVLRVMVDQLPEGAIWAAFGCGRQEMPIVAAAAAMGGHVRVGLEDNLYIRRGEFASNEQLVENAAEIITRIGGSVATPDEARDILQLTQAKDA